MAACKVDELDEDLDSVLDDIVMPNGDDKFFITPFDEALHPKNYLAWFRSTNPQYQASVVSFLKKPENIAAQHAYLTEMANIIEDKLAMLEQTIPKPPKLARTTSVPTSIPTCSSEAYSSLWGSAPFEKK
jgi:hypothetical protein